MNITDKLYYPNIKEKNFGKTKIIYIRDLFSLKAVTSQNGRYSILRDHSIKKL